MRHENRDETTSRKELDMLGMRYPRWDNRVIRSLGDEEHVDPIRASGRDDKIIPSANGRTAMTRASGRSIFY